MVWHIGMPCGRSRWADIVLQLHFITAVYSYTVSKGFLIPYINTL